MEQELVSWLWAFAFTQAVEVPIYRRAMEGQGGVAFGASALTHPVVWFVFPWLMPGNYLAMVVAAELFAWLGEALYLRTFGLKQAVWWSLAANCSSLGLGLLSRALFGRP